jgi:hypothetical protein
MSNKNNKAPATPVQIHGKVYQVTNTVTGRVYVGITTMTLVQRLAAHRAGSAARRGGPGTLAEAMRAYPAEAFQIDLLATHATHEELCAAEQYWIDTLKSQSPAGYNLNRGGSPGSNAGAMYVIVGRRFRGLRHVAAFYGIHHVSLQTRMRSQRWTIRQAVNLDTAPRARAAGEPFNVRADAFFVGRWGFSSVLEACHYFGFPPEWIEKRLAAGWTPVQAFEQARAPARAKWGRALDFPTLEDSRIARASPAQSYEHGRQERPARIFVVTNSAGARFQVAHLKAFAKAVGLNASNLYQMARDSRRGIRSSWCCRYATEEDVALPLWAPVTAAESASGIRTTASSGPDFEASPAELSAAVCPIVPRALVAEQLALW